MSAALLENNSEEMLSASPVLAELWISFVALTRSHLGALQTIGKLSKAVLSEESTNSFVLRDLSRRLSLEISLGTGGGTYKVERMGNMLQHGSWVLHEDATVRIDEGVSEDMELAVEAFARKLWENARSAQPEGKN